MKKPPVSLLEYFFRRCTMILSAMAVLLADASAADRPKAPFRTVFSNDLTNITSCPSPFNPDGQRFSEKLLKASVDETAGTGIDVHMLQPGVGWEPWWPSKVYPMAEHAAWLESRGEKPGSYHNYVLKGGDLVKVFIEECRKKGLVPFISQRLNDVHNIYRIEKIKDPVERAKVAAPVKLIGEHPEYMFGPGMKENPERYQYAVDWAHPEVREFKFKIIEELCENYDFDGLELDFMRHWAFFHPRTPPKERQKILTEFVRRVREVLDRTSKPGQHRWFCVRVPGYIKGQQEVGIDLPAFVKAGVDMVNVSGHFHTNLQMDLEAIRKMLPENVAVYEELHFNNAVAGAMAELAEQPAGKFKDGIAFRRMTDQHAYTAAHLAYARGAQGVSTFNFQYYRSAGGAPGESAEPPYHIFKYLRDPEWLARQPQLYAVAAVRNVPGNPPNILKQPFAAGDSRVTQLDMAPPEGGWKQGGRLRIQAKRDLGEDVWEVSLNGVALDPTPDVSEPYENPYKVAVGKPGDYRAWTVPADLLKDGVNEIQLTLKKGGPASIFYLDVAVQ